MRGEGEKTMNRLLNRMFSIGVWIKGINGILEAAGGILVLTIKTSTVIGIILLITQQGLIEDRHDIIANMLRHAVDRITEGAKLFGGVYLLAHGAANIFLAIGLLRSKLWSYPAAIAFLCIFIGYQIYRITLHHSVLLMIVTGLDIVIVYLIQREYTIARGSGREPIR